MKSPGAAKLDRLLVKWKKSNSRSNLSVLFIFLKIYYFFRRKFGRKLAENFQISSGDRRQMNQMTKLTVFVYLQQGFLFKRQKKHNWLKNQWPKEKN